VLDPTNYTPQTYQALLEERRRALYNNLGDMGYSPEKVKEMSQQRPYTPFTETKAQLSQQDQQALDWADANPDDPRSAKIKQRLGR
jgi:hypothetical protein